MESKFLSVNVLPESVQIGKNGPVLSNNNGALEISGTSTSIPNGGTTGQLLAKINNTDYNIEWATITGIDPSLDLSVTGAWKFSTTTSEVQILITDDNTLVSPTYVFGVFNEHSYLPNTFSDIRIIDDANDIGYSSSKNMLTNVSTTKIGAEDTYVHLSNNGLLAKAELHGDLVAITGARYANLTAVNAAIPTPSTDDRVIITGRGEAVYNGSAWVHSADDTTPINDPLIGGSGAIGVWTPTERTIPLILDEAYAVATVVQNGNDLDLTQTAAASLAKVRSNPTCYLQSGKNGLYTKLMNGAGDLTTASLFEMVLGPYSVASSGSTNYVYANFARIVGNQWTITVGKTGDTSTINVNDVDIIQAEICTVFEILSSTSVTVEVYIASNNTPIITKTVTVADTSVYKTPYINFKTAAVALMQIRVIGVPSFSYSGVSQIISTGEVDSTAYPINPEDKTFLVSGLPYNLIDVTANKILSNGCLVTFDSNGDLITSTASENDIVFYLDWYYDEVYYVENNSVWSDGVNASTLNPYGTLTLGTRREHVVANILTPNGDKLDKYEIVSIRPQIRSDSMWLTPGWIYSAGGQGTTADNHINASSQNCVVIQSGSVRLSNDSAANGGTTNSITASTSPKYARIRIVARK